MQLSIHRRSEKNYGEFDGIIVCADGMVRIFYCSDTACKAFELSYEKLVSLRNFLYSKSLRSTVQKLIDGDKAVFKCSQKDLLYEFYCLVKTKAYNGIRYFAFHFKKANNNQKRVLLYTHIATDDAYKSRYRQQQYIRIGRYLDTLKKTNLRFYSAVNKNVFDSPCLFPVGILDKLLFCFSLIGEKSDTYVSLSLNNIGLTVNISGTLTYELTDYLTNLQKQLFYFITQYTKYIHCGTNGIKNDVFSITLPFAEDTEYLLYAPKPIAANLPSGLLGA